MNKEKFDVIKVPLRDSNLIEASAGTGKTYSIAILVIRLIIEKQIALKEILMVTFTKAAVAELEVRIRKFIREAYAYATQNAEIDKTIKAIVDNGIEEYGKNEVIRLLNEARKQLDETSIFTIHSFCQKTLTEFAFETGQAFNCDVVEDESFFINDAANEYWRKNVTTLDAGLLTFLLSDELSEKKLSKKSLVEVITKARGGKLFIYKKDSTIDGYRSDKERGENEVDIALKLFNATFDTSEERTLENIGEKGHAFNAFGSLIDNSDCFREMLIEKYNQKKAPAYLGKLFPELLQLAINIEEAKDRLNDVAKNCISFIYGEAIPFCNDLIQLKKQEQSLFSFNDLINNLHDSITSVSLQKAVQKKYKAVFIDEFQDTDQKQYDIFHTFFHGHSIIFYIGDPKQSIYSFKGTDIDTYLDAADKVEHQYTMSNNFRSTAAYIESMNSLFTSIDHPFYDERIQYEIINPGLTIPEITKDEKGVEPLSVYQCSKDDDVVEQTAIMVKDLLMGEYKISEKIGEEIVKRSVIPSDIGILVRANDKGKKIKESLNNARIPAITIDDSKVLDTEQAKFLLYLLKAMYEPTTSNINRVLLTYLTGKTKEDLLQLDPEADIQFFRELNEIWTRKGVFSAINGFMKRYKTMDRILKEVPNDAERIITNVLQINEILHNKSNQSKSSPKELIHWLELVIAGAEESGEYTQRLENDEDAVKIVTIHKSKGLAYNIVIAPYLDLKSDHNANWTFIEYKDPDKNQYCFSSELTDNALQLYSEQAERENRRLIYVALTRAVYMGIIIHNDYRVKPDMGINVFLEGNAFTIQEKSKEDKRCYNERTVVVDKIPRKPSSEPVKANKNNYSFSLLSYYEPHEHPEAIEMTDDYDRFIFEGFPKGALAGNFMHYLFENSDFTETDFSGTIAKSLSCYKSVFKDDEADLEQNITDVLIHVLNSNIPVNTPFKLSQVPQENKLPEMAFSYKLNKFTTAKLHNLIPHINLEREGEIQGMMSGFVDLLFEYEGKFYILDWKSNYLGNSTEFYTSDKLKLAIQESNYHLQYLIYTVAVKLYLQNCIPDFDYNTHFGGVVYVYTRGCRKDGNTGIFYTKPEKKMVEELENVLVGEYEG